LITLSSLSALAKLREKLSDGFDLVGVHKLPPISQTMIASVAAANIQK